MTTLMLSPHFSFQELTYSETAARHGIKNVPTLEAFVHLERLAGVLETVRVILDNNAMTITSGYRSPEVNALCGGSTNSAHMSGLAADFICPGFGDPLDVCQAIQPWMAKLKVDQLIWEYGDWIHFGLVARPAVARCQCLTIDNAGTREGFC